MSSILVLCPQILSHEASVSRIGEEQLFYQELFLPAWLNRPPAVLRTQHGAPRQQGFCGDLCRALGPAG